VIPSDREHGPKASSRFELGNAKEGTVDFVGSKKLLMG